MSRSFKQQRTSKLSDRRARTHEKSKTPRRKSEAQTAVRWSALVRQSKVHRLKNLRPVAPDSQRRPALRRGGNRETRGIHENKSPPVRETNSKIHRRQRRKRRRKAPFVLFVGFCAKRPSTIRSARRNERQSSATRPTGSVDCNQSAMTGFAASHHSLISSLKSSFAPLHRPPPQALPVQLERLRFSQASLNRALINGTPFISVP